MTIEPKRALVKPRVRSYDGGTVPLENEILPLLHPGARGVIAILGGSGSSRTTALRHLACLIPEELKVRLIDNDIVLGEQKNPGLVIYTAPSRMDEVRHIATFLLAPWTHDDLIEYLLAKHKDQCASVMQRVNAADGAKLLGGNPELWSVVLDEFAADPELRIFGDALLRFQRARLNDDEIALARMGGLAKTLMDVDTVWRTTKYGPKNMPNVGVDTKHWMEVVVNEPGGDAWRLMRHEAVQMLLARQQILSDLRTDAHCNYLVFKLNRTFIRLVAAGISNEPALKERLRVLALNPALQAMAGSILHAAGTGWIPDIKTGLNDYCRSSDLRCAQLERAHWPGIQLNSAHCDGADFSHADLSGANLSRIYFNDAVLRRANLRRAILLQAHVLRANLSQADLSHLDAVGTTFMSANCSGACFDNAELSRTTFYMADLTGAQLRNANLSYATLQGAKIEGADFSGATLEKARLEGLRLREAKFTAASFISAFLQHCDMEFMELPGANFCRAQLKNALLTGSFIPNGNFITADLSGAALADIEWERADLRNADLTGCSFHMGSSRSGRLDSDIACEGSRTGFYTDDYFDQPFKAPEEIRKANLRGADLRGAKLDKTDFYLVDLRGALYDAAQAEHLRRCGAILESRV
jgi:uncharacterized protein YjbI with pentapeptide repeats